MKYKTLGYTRKFNLGNYETEEITLTAELDKPEELLTEGLEEVYRTIKAQVLKLHGATEPLEQAQKQASSGTNGQNYYRMFPDEWHNRLELSVKDGTLIVKPKHFLGGNLFPEIAEIIRKLNGEYHSQGKESYFTVPLKE